MAIDRNKLLQDMYLYLPDENVLEDVQLSSIAENIIAAVGDEDTNYPEILCKSLKAAAQVNKAKFQVDSASIKKERVGDTQNEYFSSGKFIWDNFIDSLKDLCPIFGYTGLSSGIGIKIKPGDEIDILKDCPCSGDLYL